MADTATAGVRAARAGGRALGAALAAAALLALSGCMPLRQPMGPAVQAPRIEGDALVAADGLRLPLRAWLPEGPPRAAIVAVHGMNDYSRAFDMPAAHWAGQGIATYAYDQRGFGAAPQPGVWADTRTLAADLEAAVDAVAARHPGLPIYLLGESMGGAVVVAALAAREAGARAQSGSQPPGTQLPRTPLAQRVRGVILSAPALWGRPAMPVLYRLTLWAAYRTVPGLEVSPPAGLKIVPSDNLPMLRDLACDPRVLKRTRIDAIQGLVDLMDEAYAGVDRLPPQLPVLVLYGLHEQVLARESVSLALRHLQVRREAGARIRVAVYGDGYHMLLRGLSADAVWRDVQAWLDDAQAPLPSRGDRAAWREHQDKASLAAERERLRELARPYRSADGKQAWACGQAPAAQAHGGGS